MHRAWLCCECLVNGRDMWFATQLRDLLLAYQYHMDYNRSQSLSRPYVAVTVIVTVMSTGSRPFESTCSFYE